MNIETLTPVFPPSKTPHRTGVYLASEKKDVVEKAFRLYALWDGQNWGCTHSTIEAAARHPDFEFAVQQKYWRGLAEEPTACGQQ